MHKRILLLLASVLAGFSLGNAQTLFPQSGYAVITPQGGSITTLTPVETIFTNEPVVGFAQIDVAPSPLLTSGVLPVTIGSTAATGNALVLVNRSLNPATVNLVITDASGVEILNRTFVVASGEQFIQFVNDLFIDQPDLIIATAGLLTIQSNIPIAALALDFRGVAFTTVPITISGVGSVATVNPAPAVVIPVSTASCQAVCTPTTLGFVPGLCVPAAIVVPTSLSSLSACQSTTIGVAPLGCVPTTIGVAPIGFVPTTIGVAPTTIGVAPTTVAVVSTTTRTVATTAVTTPVTTVQLPASIATIGGEFVFPGLMSAQGIATNITVGNTSDSNQGIRVDVFTAAGEFVNTATVLIPARGLVVLPSGLFDIVPVSQ